MKLSVVYPVLGQFPLTQTAIDFAVRNLSGECDVEVVILDNGSDKHFKYRDPQIDEGESTSMKDLLNEATVYRINDNIGVYPTFWWGLEKATGDVIAFLHSDLIINEKGWDKRVLKAFEDDQNLGLVGFIGSSEIDSAGGRGYGTISNFQGDEYIYSDGIKDKTIWKGSPTKAHGIASNGLSQAKVIDGCAMIFRRSVLEQIPQRPEFPPHHFYDRLLSCEVLERGYNVAVLGIACDHISNATVSHEQKYWDMAEEWCKNHGLAPVEKGIKFSTSAVKPNWDMALYQEAERQWLGEYREMKHFIPCHI